VIDVASLFGEIALFCMKGEVISETFLRGICEGSSG
jgi:hypothetical protein